MGGDCGSGIQKSDDSSAVRKHTTSADISTVDRLFLARVR